MLEGLKSDASYTVAVKLVTTVEINPGAARPLPIPGCTSLVFDGEELLSTDVSSADFAKDVGRLSVAFPSVKEVGAMLSGALALGLSVARDVDGGRFDAAVLRRLVDEGEGGRVIVGGDLGPEALAALDAAGVAAMGAGFLAPKAA